MKKIRVKYTDWWDGFEPENYRIHKILTKHFRVELSDTPDYVISSVYSKDFMKYECVRILYTGENICPDFNLFDYAIGFEHLDFGDRYLRFPNYLMNPLYENDINLMLSKHLVTLEGINDKTEFCDFVYSNQNADPIREKMFYKLNEYKRVNSGGKFMNNVGMAEGVLDKFKFQKKHKFSIAFENSSHYGYTTEKLVQSFAAQTIPIYWGDPNISEVFNTKAMINVSEFSSLDDVVNKVKEVDQNEKLYCTMLSEPAMVQETVLEEKYQELETFLVNIFSQPLMQAGRRNKGMAVKRYYSIEDKNTKGSNARDKKIGVWNRISRVT